MSLAKQPTNGWSKIAAIIPFRHSPSMVVFAYASVSRFNALNASARTGSLERLALS